MTRGSLPLPTLFEHRIGADMLNIDDGQMDFFDGDDPQILADFNKWVHTPGGRHIANRLFRKAAAYVADYERYGIQVSMKLLWELQRHEINKTRARMGARIHGSLTLTATPSITTTIDIWPSLSSSVVRHGTAYSNSETNVARSQKRRGTDAFMRTCQMYCER